MGEPRPGNPSSPRRGEEGLLSEERIQLLRSWRRSGFGIDQSVRIPAGEKKGLEDVARYMLRAPVSLSRMRWNRGDKELFYAPNVSHDHPEDLWVEGQPIDALEFVCGGKSSEGSPATSDIFEAAPKRTIRSSDHTDP